jgi:hypothetical protein
VLQGDVSGDGGINVLDVIRVRNRIGATAAGGGAWDPVLDVNADGAISAADVSLVFGALGRGLPAGTPSPLSGAQVLSPAMAGASGNAAETDSAPAAVGTESVFRADFGRDLAEQLALALGHPELVGLAPPSEPRASQEASGSASGRVHPQRLERLDPAPGRSAGELPAAMRPAGSEDAREPRIVLREPGERGLAAELRQLADLRAQLTVSLKDIPPAATPPA